MNLIKKNKSLILIFLLAIILRFLYFPYNTYFGFDQARDAYAVKEILSGSLKIVGPPTANGILHHGSLYYYIFAPFYLISGGDPAAVSLFLRILNAAGIFLIFFTTLVLFDKKIAIVAAFLFAVSFEQTQFALFLNHPSLAVISVLFFYLGLGIWVFKKLRWGFYLGLFGLGLSIQFEFVEIQLIAILALYIFLFRESFFKFRLKDVSLDFLFFLLPLSTYLISEIKNGFPIVRQSQNLLFNGIGKYSILDHLGQVFPMMTRHFQDNLAANFYISLILAPAYLFLFIYFIYIRILRKQSIFLAIWFFAGFLVYLFIKNDAYFYNTGTSISLLILTALLLKRFCNRWFAAILLILIVISNMFLITKNNPIGPNQKINPQIGLLLNDEQKVLDYIYQTANKEEFAVNALTMPYNVNTTWSYLFEWYGKKKYGYVPVWGGDAAEGFPGGLKVERARSKLPDKRFLIIEPLEGIPGYLVDGFLTDEQQYTSIIEKKRIGTMQVWVQQPK